MTIEAGSELAPLGMGSQERPALGNASLKTVGYDSTGALKTFETRFWISAFSTDLELKMTTNHLRRGASYIPIRSQERYIGFTAQFKAQNSNYELMSRRIRAHWQVNMNLDATIPMTFTYYGAGRQWLGFLEEIQHSAKVTEVIYSRSFQMRVINRDASSEAAQITQNGPGVPSRGDVHTDWEGWYGQSSLAAEAERLLAITPAPTPAPNPGIDTDTGGVDNDTPYGPPSKPLFGPPTAADL